MQTSSGCSSRGCSCLRSALPLARARSAPTKLTEQTIGGYGIPAIPTHPPNYLPTEATETTEVSDARYSPTEPTEHTETTGARYSPTDCTDVHRLGGYGIPAIPTLPPNYLSTETTEPTEVSGARYSPTPEVSVCSVNSVGEPYATTKLSVLICTICGRIIKWAAWVWQGCHTLLSVLCGRTPPGEKTKRAWRNAMPSYVSYVDAWVWQGCHTLL